MDEAADDIRIELPRDDDAPAVGRLFHEDMSDLGVDTSVEAMVALAAEVIADMRAQPRQCLCWVARPHADAAEPCGVVLANFHWSLKFAGRALWIEELYVTPAFRRRGIGAKLVGRVLDFAEAHDIRGIDLEAYQGNTPASILYRSLGFHRLGRERFYYRLGNQEYL